MDIELFEVLAGNSAVWVLILEGQVLTFKKLDALQTLIGPDLVANLTLGREPHTVPDFLEFAKNHSILKVVTGAGWRQMLGLPTQD